MCDSKSDCLKMYQPMLIEEHSDSSDFEEPTLDVPKIKKNKLLLNKELLRKISLRNKNLNCSNHKKCDANKSKYGKIFTEKKVQVPDTEYMINNIELNDLEEFNRLNQQKCKVANYSISELYFRNKTPCLSKIFRRSSRYDKHLSVIEENNVRNDRKENGCNVYNVLCNNSSRKLRKMRISNLDQPVYELQRKTHTSFNSSIILDYAAPRVNKARKPSGQSTYTTLPMFSSVSSELDVVTLEDKEYSNTRYYHNQYKKNMSKPQTEKKIRSSYEVNYANKQNYQVFSSPKNDKDANTSFHNDNINHDVLGSEVFWDYVATKVEQKNRQQKGTCSKPCDCSHDLNNSKPKDACCNKTNACGGCKAGECFDNEEFSMCLPPSPNYVVPEGKKPIKAECQCPSAESLPKSYDKKIDDVKTRSSKPCQQDHELVSKSLANKYKGKILCIHNPQCILINGCLNVPLKENSTPTWYVTQDKSNKYEQNNITNMTTNHIIDLNNDQSHSRYIDVMQYYKDEDRIEKETQSLCHHYPPCKYVRMCYRQKYSPKLDVCCVHVPMCRKVPQCVLETEDFEYGFATCDHKPKCTELPVCAREWIMFGEICNVQSEVKNYSDLVCKHNPPCIKIPRCLGHKMCEGRMPCAAIPDCTHQPPCDTIPACFRRTRKMVSTCSQYPAPCRIV